VVWSPRKRKRPKLFRVTGRQLNSFPPKSAQLRAYVLTCPVGMVPTCTWRHCWAIPTVPQLEQPILNLRNFHRSQALFVVLHHIVDPRAHAKASHQPGIERLQQTGKQTSSATWGGDPFRTTSLSPVKSPA